MSKALLPCLVAGWALTSACARPTYANTAPSLQSHGAYFNIASGSHAAMDCNACHGQTDSFQQYSCTGCHDHDKVTTDAAHSGLTPNYVYSDTSCYQCHSAGTTLQFNHVPYFPIRAGDKHQGVVCVNCHTTPTNRKAEDCLTCHPANPTDAFHVNVGGYAQVSTTCLQCHGNSQVDRIAAHAFHINSGYKHYLIACATCHPAFRADKPYALDFTQHDCLGCHPASALAPTHTPLAKYSYANASCAQSGCHALGTRTAALIGSSPVQFAARWDFIPVRRVKL